MNFSQFEAEFLSLGVNCKTKDIDRFNRGLIKSGTDVSFLADVVLSEQKYHRTFFQVSLGQIKGIEGKFAFIEKHFDKLQDWWHVDQLTQFVGKELTFDFAYEKAREYIESSLPFARRWGYVMFMPTLVKQADTAEKLLSLFKDDDEYYVQMAEAWLISYIGIYHTDLALKYLSNCPLKYNIAGKAIQKICDSFRISEENKALFKKLRQKLKQNNLGEINISLTDDEWPYEYTDHDRTVVRAIVVDKSEYFYFVRANRDDDFGKAVVIETSGGGVEDGEELTTAILRELKEELGVEAEILCKIGVVSDYYNLIHRHNINNYYLCRAVSFGEKSLTEDEANCFHLSTLKMSFDKAVEEYERCRDSRLGRIIYNREMPILLRAKEILEKK